MLAAPIFLVYVSPLGLRLSISLRALFACVLSQRTEATACSDQPREVRINIVGGAVSHLPNCPTRALAIGPSEALSQLAQDPTSSNLDSNPSRSGRGRPGKP